MTGEIEQYRPGALDSWAEMFRPVVLLAEHVHSTEFVPKALRGNAPAVAASMMYGRELGFGPMRALQTVHVVDGRPTLAAEQMRAMVLAEGHEIVYREHTKARCVVSGRRKGETAYTTVEWSLADAREMNLVQKPNWRRMPRQMLVARATAELCRMIFADVIGGAYATEELSDGDVVPAAPPVAAEQTERPTTRRRTARRTTPVAAALPERVDIEQADDRSAADLPPLPDDDSDQAGDEQDAPDDAARDPRRPVTQDQLTALHSAFTEHDITDRDDKLRIARLITSRPALESSTHLSVREASQILDTIRYLETQAGSEFGDALDALLAEIQAQQANQHPTTDDTTDIPEGNDET